MADHRVRRTWIRRATAALLAATVASVGSSTPGTVVAMAPVVAPAPSPVAVAAPPTVVEPVGPATATGSIGAGGPILTPALGKALQTRLTNLRKKYAYPGVSVAIIFPDGTTWAGTSGYADVAARKPVTADTAFAVASVSKTFTAALVMSLVQDGKIALDRPVRAYLPDLKIGPKVTVRQLLDHTSGLRDYFLDKRIDPALLKDPTRRWTTADALAFVGKPYFKPGRGWHYSNTNYLVLGMLAERAGGAPIAAQLRARFLDPLGLLHTYYQASEAPRGRVAHGYRFATAATDATAIDLSDGSDVVPFTSVVTAAAGAGSIASTATDLARWARSLYAGGALSEATVASMVADVVSTSRYRPAIPYGLGVQGVGMVGHPALGHSGRLLGFRSLMRYLPDEGVTIAVLTNQSRTDPGIIGRSLLKLALRSAPSCACQGVR
jgi:D-alanyl-D-alanine carboxypeptidase